MPVNFSKINLANSTKIYRESLVSNYGFIKAASNAAEEICSSRNMLDMDKLVLALTFKNCVRLDMVLMVSGEQLLICKMTDLDDA